MFWSSCFDPKENTVCYSIKPIKQFIEIVVYVEQRIVKTTTDMQRETILLISNTQFHLARYYLYNPKPIVL